MNQRDCLRSPKGISSVQQTNYMKKGAKGIVASFVDVLNHDSNSECWLERVAVVYWMKVW